MRLRLLGYAFVLSLAGENLIFSGHAKPLVDEYGQYLHEQWPEKVTRDTQLHQEGMDDLASLQKALPEAASHDRYGGLADGRQRAATGFFRVEKEDGRWWLITPLGNRFFMRGVDAVSYQEWGYWTSLINPDQTPRSEFNQLPDRVACSEAYQGNTINFIVANLKRKYGADYAAQWKAVTRHRLLSWGFNSTGQWGWGVTHDLPYVEDFNLGEDRHGVPVKVPIRRLPGRVSSKSIDPFDPNFSAAIKDSLSRTRPECRTDPMLIGWSVENENGWNVDSVRDVLAQPADSPAKQALLAFLIQRHGEAETAKTLGLSRATQAALLNQPLPITALAEQDVRDFIRLASQRYHQTLRDELRKYDPNHVFLGAGSCDEAAPEWIEEQCRYVDALNLHDYSLKMELVEKNLPIYQKFDKPFMVLEYNFEVAARGMGTIAASCAVQTQRERGLAYRYFTEQLAANPLCLGQAWFVYYDQPLTGRGSPPGECFNAGLVNQCDQPYAQMLEPVKISNTRLPDIHAGRLSPVTLGELGGLKVASDGFMVSDTKQIKIPFRNHDQKPDLFFAVPMVIAANTDIRALIYFSWDKNNLYLLAKVVDEHFYNAKSGADIWDGDCLELWLNDLQFGFTAVGKDRQPHGYSWTREKTGLAKTTFMTTDDLGKDADIARQFGPLKTSGWILTATIPWNLLPEGQPAVGKPFKMAVGFDYADGKSTGRKGQIYFPKGWRHGDKTTFQNAVLNK